MTRSHRTLAAILALAVAWGCSGTDTQAPTPPRPQEYFGASVQSLPQNVLAAAMIVRAKAYDSAYVQYSAGLAGPTVSTPAIGFAGATEVRVPVLGLDTATSYTFRVVLTLIGAADSTVDSLPFTSGALPAWIPVIGSIGTSAEPGYLAISLPEGVVTVDNSGKVVWYYSSPNSTLNTFQAHPSGSYSLMGAGPGQTAFQLLNPLGEQTGSLACVGRPTYFHDLLIAPGGDAWILCSETRVMDLTAVGGLAAANVIATVVQHLSPAGALLWEWNAFDHFEITDIPLTDRVGVNVDFTHVNAIDFDADSNLLLSFRTPNEVTKVDRATGAVIWRFGGLAGQFTILNDPSGLFERQHGVRWAGTDRIQMLDIADSPPSRFVRYFLDTTAMTATLEWEFIDSPTTYGNVGGSSQYHPDGHGTVSFGRAGRIVEVDGSGNKVWELTGLDNAYAFRVQRLGSLYTAGRGEPTR